MVAPPCFIYYDRHVEKNAGSTMRVLMKRLEEHGECAYWGYFQSDQAWSTAMALRHFTQSVAPPRLCVEAHTGVDASARLVQLSGLKRALQERGSSCRVLRSLRIRDPVSHYLSFFTWGVTQRSTLSAQDARLFLSWANATPNLQSSILLSPSAGRAVAGWQGKYYHDLHSHARSQHLVPGWSATAHGRLVALLEHIDLLAPLEEFEAALLLTAEELGRRHIQHHAVNSDCIGTLSERVDLDRLGLGSGLGLGLRLE